MVTSRVSATLGTTIAVLVTSFIFVSLRFVSKTWIVRKISVDDWLILLAWILTFGLSFSICYATRVGLGLHSQYVHREWHVPLQKAEYAFTVLYNPCLMTTKTSIILFFLSLAEHQKIFKWCNYLILVVVNVPGLALTIVGIAQCRPLHADFVYPTPSTAKCVNIVGLYLASAPVNIITDLALLFLPMPLLTRMHLPRKQKIILIITFSFGIFVAVVDVIRISSLQNAASARVENAMSESLKGNSLRDLGDFSWYASLSFMWSAVEVNTGIMVACVPSLKPLVQRFHPSWIRDDNEKTGRYGSTVSEGSDEQEPPSISPDTPDTLTNPAAVVQGSPHSDPDDHNGEMGFMEFLSRTQTNTTATTLTAAVTTYREPTFFDFVNMKQPKNMLRLSNRECFMPVAVVTILFFLWGFAYGFLNVLNQDFQNVAKLSNAESWGLHASYYGGYFLSPLTLGRWALTRFGFKATMIAGLIVYACGTLIFWPAAVLTSYPAFVASNVIVASGLSTLEIAANPFIALCGPLEYAEIRLNIAQGVQAIGTVVSPLLASRVLFKKVQDAPSLINVQWTYLGIALFDVLLAVALYYLPLPEATDEDLDETAGRRRSVYDTKIGGRVPVIWVTLCLGVFSQWCYVGGQENIGTTTQILTAALKRHGYLSPSSYQTIGHAIFAVGRFLCASLIYVFKPRWVLLGLYTGLIITTALTMSLTSNASIAMLLLSYLFESGVFSLIFAICLRGMGVHTKTACTLLTTAICGGAPFPPIQSAVANSHSVRYSFCVPLAIFAFGALFPIYLNVIPEARNQVDPVHDSQPSRRRRDALLPTRSREVDGKTENFGLMGIVARHRRYKTQQREREKSVTSCNSMLRHVERCPGAGLSISSSECGQGKLLQPRDLTNDDTNGIVVLGQGLLNDLDSKKTEERKETASEAVVHGPKRHDHAYSRRARF